MGVFSYFSKISFSQGKKPVLTLVYEFDECHLAGILANKADESLKEKLDLVDHLCENTFWARFTFIWFWAARLTFPFYP